ncbi:hypothetical protein DACRYDRAFT_46449 [Dacryopinax primogenitus]|uniref:Snf7-domain-containing protein n=1 Tax=Dacryopinax primogenitus (strain DJM 731) TaxID=1858805 RepID=M5GAF5_DACPD|nr:uncharacterized protein DACRYDRAFT_46449 [Dacryopinax primogenitus]EJU05330.1 hypothetical protein DACRYDRAFT_46449 [Dacryopinax primogenitus]
MASSSRLSFLPSSIPTPSPQRIHALYADFSRQKLFNPSAYAANVDWWRTALPEIVAYHQNLQDHIMLDVGDKLIEKLRMDVGARPLSMDTVTLEMVESSSLYPLMSFLTSPYSIYDTSSLPWKTATYLIGKPIWWAMGQLRLVGDRIPADESVASRWKRAKGKYVIKANLEKAADAILEHEQSKSHLSIVDRLHNAASFLKEYREVAFPGVVLSETDVKALLKYLERDRKAIVMEKEVIKFIDEDSAEETITEVDRGVLEMKIAIERIESQMDDIERRMSECLVKAKQALAKKQQQMAKSYLRSRNQLNELLTKRGASLETLHTVLLKIESAAGDVEVMRAYETSTLTMKKLLEDPRLQREYVDDTLESMAEVLADYEEVEEATKLGGERVRLAAGREADESEIEEELDDLVREQEKLNNTEEVIRAAETTNEQVKESLVPVRGTRVKENAAARKSSPRLEAQRQTMLES